MKTTFTKTLALMVTTILLSSCAANYTSLSPESMHYQATSESNGIKLQYKHGVLGEQGNKKYVKKETKSSLKVAAVKLTNNSPYAVDVTRDIKFFSGSDQFSPLAPNVAHAELKQGVPVYLLYLLFTPMKLVETSTVNGVQKETSSVPIGYLLGPGLTFYNILKSSNANKKMLQNLQQYDITNKQLAPGETLHGLIVIPNGSYNPLNIKVGEDIQSKN